ncbi:MAG TPA: PadR family transcriptional regulator [Acidimicrobiales bacterium]|nr:PadR family transcriptional regulator [Acidimicrobiales bacterium]
MSPSPGIRPSPLALTVLAMLAYEPLHPYRMQRLMQLWGKDRVVNIGARANLYRTINRLHEAGLITVRQTERDQQYPERTVYELTEEGRAASHEWLTEMLSAPRHEFPEFPAALSFTMLLGPQKTLEVLERRATVLAETLAGLDHDLAGGYDHLPRVTMLETEYLRAVTAAELTWLTGVVDDLRGGVLGWTYEELAAAVDDDATGDPDTETPA